MKCGVCRYPNENRAEYFQTPQYFPYKPRPIEISKEAIAMHRALNPDKIDPMNMSMTEFNCIGEYYYELLKRGIREASDQKLFEHIRKITADPFDPVI